MLLTRSPLYSRPKAPKPFDLHVLGTPPAFILSQDQTLRLKSAASLPRSILVFAGSPGPSVGWARLAGISRFDSSRNIRFSRFPPPLPGGLAASLPGERRKEILYLPVAILSRTFFRNFRRFSRCR